jgi:uncharacterized tellurite resistance protein B-like protein
MLNNLKEFFAQVSSDVSPEDRKSHEVRLAAAALLVVCGKSDFEAHPEEEDAIVKLLEVTFGLEKSEIRDLMRYADDITGEVGLHEFTRLVNQHYTADDKLVLIDNIWQVAVADGRLDRFEEQYIARVAFLIDISQEQVKRSREFIVGAG